MIMIYFEVGANYMLINLAKHLWMLLLLADTEILGYYLTNKQHEQMRITSVKISLDCMNWNPAWSKTDIASAQLNNQALTGMYVGKMQFTAFQHWHNSYIFSLYQVIWSSYQKSQNYC